MCLTAKHVDPRQLFIAFVSHFFQYSRCEHCIVHSVLFDLGSIYECGGERIIENPFPPSGVSSFSVIVCPCAVEDFAIDPSRLVAARNPRDGNARFRA